MGIAAASASTSRRRARRNTAAILDRDSRAARCGSVARGPAHRTEGRLIVRRVNRLNPKATAQGQHELFATYRYHAVFTDSPFRD